MSPDRTKLDRCEAGPVGNLKIEIPCNTLMKKQNLKRTKKTA